MTSVGFGNPFFMVTSGSWGFRVGVGVGICYCMIHPVGIDDGALN